MKYLYSFYLLLSFCLFLSLNVLSQSIVINEVMASNANTIADEDGDFEDWVELYNFGEEPVNLIGFGLSDNYSNPFKWVFPNTTINPGQYLLVWTSGKNRTNPSNPLHTNFSISAAGEEIILTHPDGDLVDELEPTSIPTNFTFGRFPNGTGEWKYFTKPTPWSENIGPAYDFLVDPPVFSHPDGIYTSAFDLILTTTFEGAQIFYTLDGSEPNESSTLFQNPITISSRVGEPNDISMIPTNNNSEPGPPYYEGWQPPLGEVYKINVVRARVIHPNAPPSNVSTYSYMVEPSGNNRFTLPFISISTHRDNFFDGEIGIYVHGNHQSPNYFQDGIEWERPANITLFEKGGILGFKEDVGIRLHGNTTRSRPRKSLRISSKSEYGNSWISYQLFPDKPINTYKRFILRNSGNDWDWAIFRDAFIQYLAKDLRVETQYYRPSLVFINGEYWGIHNIRDRYDEHYIFSHYGIEEMEMTIMENNSLFKFGNPSGVDHYNSMRSYINGNNMSLDVHYNHVKMLMDVESFIDFQLTHIYSMNTDWPGNNTLYWRYLREGYDPTAPAGKDGRWRWFILDTDFGFGLPFFYVPGVNEGPAHNTLSFATVENGPSWPNPSWSTFLLRKLLNNQKFRHQFINRYCDLLNTTFSSSHVVSVIDSIAGILEPEMAEHVNRWRRPTTFSEWNSNVNVLRSFAQQRPSYQYQHLKQKFGLSGEANVTLNVSNEIYGFIRINSINISKETMGVEAHPYPWVGKYFKNIPIEVEAIAKPGYQFSHWSGAYSSSEPNLTITLTSDIELTAHFTKTDNPQLIHFWFFGNSLPNDTPLETINTTHSLLGGAAIQYHSALEGYPFSVGHPNWRKASMERRNSPTSINYRPEGNNGISYAGSNMRGIQIKQPFTGDGGENTLFFNAPTKGFENIVFRFAAINEGAADGLIIDYSVVDGEPDWISSGLASTNFPLSSSYQLFVINFSDAVEANNNPNFKIRIRFYGSNMSVDAGNRVTFNNISIDGVSLTAYSIAASAGGRGAIEPKGNIGVYSGSDKSFSIIPQSGFNIVDVVVDGQSVLNEIEVDENGAAHYIFSNVTSNHTIHASFSYPSGIIEGRDQAPLSIFPNPASEYANIHSVETINRIEIFNLLGTRVYSDLPNTKEYRVNLISLGKGIHIVRVYTPTGVSVGRLMID